LSKYIYFCKLVAIIEEYFFHNTSFIQIPK